MKRSFHLRQNGFFGGWCIMELLEIEDCSALLLLIILSFASISPVSRKARDDPREPPTVSYLFL